MTSKTYVNLLISKILFQRASTDTPIYGWRGSDVALPFQQFYFLFQQILVLERESVPSVDTLCSDEWYLLWQWMVLCSQTRSLYDIKEKKKELPTW